MDRARGHRAFVGSLAVTAIRYDTIFTNVAMTPDGDVWWERIGLDPPRGTLNWQGMPWVPHSGQVERKPSRPEMDLGPC
ncbi:MAG: phosphoenolpyruvate carboxykinase domain-containing protein [Candidatus Binataceae bacterium]